MTPPPPSAPSNSNDWPRATAAQAGFAPDLAARIDALAASPAGANLHGVVVVRGGALVTERYFSGPDQRWGEALGEVCFTPDTRHDLRSISKSVVSLLYGIALGEGLVPPPETPLLAAFADHGVEASDPRWARATVGHALSMQLGLAWDESLPYSDPRNSEIAMERAADRCRYVLAQPFAAEPGTRWVYNGGATALLAALIVAGTGRSLLDYARSALFGPLGIEDVEWVVGRDGLAAPASGLRMRPADLARVGQLILDGGRRGDAQVVPSPWIDSCLHPHARVDDDFDYGYHWWIARRWRWVAAFGNGGQRLQVLPRANVVLVITAGNYNAPDAWKVPVAVLVDAVLPALLPAADGEP